jgi:hypothetical protein
MTMAVLSVKSATKLVLTTVTGVDAKGDDIKRSMNLSKIKVAATDEALFATAKAIEPLLKYPVVEIGRDDAYNLSEA